MAVVVCNLNWAAPLSHASPSLSLSLLPLRSAERGLSNYLIYHSSKTDAKVAAAAADVGQYADDAEGNLYKRV
jgi:hypothetical protein